MENNKIKPIEFEGKTIEEAIRKALALLKVSRNDLKIKVLSEEQKGLFGMAGAKPAKIRVTMIKPATLKKKT